MSNYQRGDYTFDGYSGYLYVSPDREIDQTLDLEDDLIMDIAADGMVVGIEFLGTFDAEAIEDFARQLDLEPRRVDYQTPTIH